MKLIRMLGNRIDGMSYRAVAAVMKKNYLGMAKKYKDKKLDSYIEKICKAIDDKDRDAHNKYVAKLRVRMLNLDDVKRQMGGTFVCKFPTCNQKATHVDISINEDRHIVFCDKHFKLYDNLDTEHDNEKK